MTENVMHDLPTDDVKPLNEPTLRASYSDPLTTPSGRPRNTSNDQGTYDAEGNFRPHNAATIRAMRRARKMAKLPLSLWPVRERFGRGGRAR